MTRVFVFAVLFFVNLSSTLAIEFTVTKIVDSEHDYPDFFATSDGVLYGGDELLFTDGFTQREFKTNPDGNSKPTSFTRFNDQVLLIARPNNTGFEWYEYLGDRLEPLPDLSTDGTTTPVHHFVFQDRLYFSGFADGYGNELMAYDGENTSVVADLRAGPESSGPNAGDSRARELLTDANRVLLHATEGEFSGRQFFVLTESGISPVEHRPFHPDNSILYWRDSAQTSEYNYFTICHPDNTCSLMAVNENESVEVEHISVVDGPLHLMPRHFSVFEDTAYFIGRYGTHPSENTVYRLDGTNLLEVAGAIGSSAMYPHDSGLLVSRGDRMYKIDSNGNVANVTPDELLPVRPSLQVVQEHNGSLYFEARRRLYSFDGREVSKVSDETIHGIASDSQIQSTPEGIFLSDGLSVMWTDGVSELVRIPGIEFYSTAGGIAFGGAFFAHAIDESGAGVFKFVISDSVARVDTNHNGVVDAEDINAHAAALLIPNPHLVYDYNGDKVVDDADRATLIHDFAGTVFGDSNLDGEFNSRDLVNVFVAAEYEDNMALNSTWDTGDWSGDMEFTSQDLVLAFQDGGYEQGPRDDVATVPEPTASVLTLSVILMICRKECARVLPPNEHSNL